MSHGEKKSKMPLNKLKGCGESIIIGEFDRKHTSELYKLFGEVIVFIKLKIHTNYEQYT